MAITIKYFASLKESMGVDSESLAAESVNNVQEVLNKISQVHTMPENLLVAVNQEYARFDSAVVDGDEVAFFPPVTGG